MIFCSSRSICELGNIKNCCTDTGVETDSRLISDALECGDCEPLPFPDKSEIEAAFTSIRDGLNGGLAGRGPDGTDGLAAAGDNDISRIRLFVALLRRERELRRLALRDCDDIPEVLANWALRETGGPFLGGNGVQSDSSECFPAIVRIRRL